MRKINLIIGFLTLILFFGCNSPKNNSAFEILEEEGILVDSPQSVDIERKLIKEGFVEFETENIKDTRKFIFQSIKKHNGYVSSDEEYNSSGRLSNTIIIRVPAKNFDNLLNESTKNIEKFDNKEIEVKDVTEEFLDIQARLKTKKELENRYIELLKKANSVIEILEVEKQIGVLRSEIESIEGRLKYLESKVSLSTLTMTFYQKIPTVIEFGDKFKSGFKNGWDNLIWFFVFMINIWPFILIGLGLIFGLRIWKRNKKKSV